MNNWENFRRGARRDLERTKRLVMMQDNEVVRIPASVASQDDLSQNLKDFLYSRNFEFKVKPSYEDEFSQPDLYIVKGKFRM